MIYISHQVDQRLRFFAALDHQRVKVWRGMSTPWRLSIFSKRYSEIPSTYLVVSNNASTLGLARLFSLSCAACRPCSTNQPQLFAGLLTLAGVHRISDEPGQLDRLISLDSKVFYRTSQGSMERHSAIYG